jgi:hypothetical protein
MADQAGAQDIYERILALAARIDAPANLLPQIEERGREGTVWIGVSEAENAYTAVYFERGLAHQVITTYRPDHVVRQLLDGITFSMAVREHRGREAAPTGDLRVPLFAIQERLMEQVDPAWAEELRAAHARTLATQPPVILK